MMEFNSFAPKRCGSNFTSVFFKIMLQIDFLSASCEIVPKRVQQNPIADGSTVIYSGNGLMPSGSKPLPDPMLTQIYVAK